MIKQIKKSLDLFVLDNADGRYRVRHGYAFFLDTLFIVKHYLN